MEAQAKLEEVIGRQLSEAVAKRDQAAVLRFAWLYKPLGKQAEGLSRVVEFLRLTVAAKARAAYGALTGELDAGKNVDFAAALAALFKVRSNGCR